MLRPGGLVLVDKPAGPTSHDVVARVRKLAGTRRVGHAGTLDPMATGVLVVGVDRATKLLGHLTGCDKAYEATIRLGVTTVTDDADGEVLTATSAAGVTPDAVRAGLAALTGTVDQVPAAVSAVKVDGRRAYARVRAGQAVDLPPRRVTVSRLEPTRFDRTGQDTLDVDVSVECSAGTYVRAIARDLGAALGVGGHLTALRRVRVGRFTIDQCAPLDDIVDLGRWPVTVDLNTAVTRSFDRRDLDRDEADALANGRPLPPVGLAGPYGAFDPDGHVIALLAERDGLARPLVVLRPA